MSELIAVVPLACIALYLIWISGVGSLFLKSSDDMALRLPIFASLAFAASSDKVFVSTAYELAFPRSNPNGFALSAVCCGLPKANVSSTSWSLLVGLELVVCCCAGLNVLKKSSLPKLTSSFLAFMGYPTPEFCFLANEKPPSPAPRSTSWIDFATGLIAADFASVVFVSTGMKTD